jgi:hypothetical protein
MPQNMLFGTRDLSPAVPSYAAGNRVRAGNGLFVPKASPGWHRSIFVPTSAYEDWVAIWD